ncbi:MAG: YegP family protein [Myxococcota bacterium]
MNRPWPHRLGSFGTNWSRHALMAPLAIALAVGAGACNSSADGDDSSGPTDPTETPGGKADNPNGSDSMVEMTMEAIPAQPGRLDMARSQEGNWAVRLLGPGGDIYLTSTTAYQSNTSGLNGILSMEENGVLLDRYRVTPIGTEECSFELRAGNNQTIARGPVFRDCDEAESRIAATRDLVAGVVQFKASVSAGAQFDLSRDLTDNQWYFVLYAADRRVLLESQPYTARTSAINGIESVRENGKLPERYRLVTNDDGTVSISLRAANHHEIAQGGPFAEAEQAQSIIDESVELLVSERVGNPW